uniref:Uncharacterized protein n=1 Tax=Aegilops tauschii subsp. strangulata TaxID=200361 RepID=A0A453SHD1_AEGTS
RRHVRASYHEPGLAKVCPSQGFRTASQLLTKNSHQPQIPAEDAGQEADAAADGGCRRSLLSRLLLVTCSLICFPYPPSQPNHCS